MRCRLLHTNIEQTIVQENNTIVELEMPYSGIKIENHKNFTALNHVVILIVPVSFVKTYNRTFTYANVVTLNSNKNDAMPNIESEQLQRYFPNVIVLQTRNIFIRGKFCFSYFQRSLPRLER